MQRLLKLRSYILPYRKAIYIGFGCLILTNFCLMIIPLFLKNAIDVLGIGANDPLYWQSSGKKSLMFYVLAIVGAAILQAVFRTLSRTTIFNSARGVEYEFRNQIFAHIQRLPTSFFQKTASGQLMATLTNDIIYIRLLYGIGILQILNTFISYSFTLPAVLSLNLSLSLMILTLIPLIFLACRGFVHKIFVESRRNQELFGDMNSVLNESFVGIRELKAYGAAGFREHRFSEVSQQYLQSSVLLTKQRLFFYQGMYLMSGLGMVLILAYGGSQVAKAQMTLGDLVAFIAYLGILSWPVYMMGWVVPACQRGLSAFARIEEILATPTETAYSASATDKELQDGSIRLQQVSFAYPRVEDDTKVGNGKQALAKLSLTINSGDKVLITGPTASGKSTLLKLLSGLYTTDQGRLEVGKLQANAKNSAAIRIAVSYCPQDAFVFSRSLRENILYATTATMDINDATSISALKLDEPQFVHSWETLVGEQGFTLSGGQRQRTALARALAKKAKILLLDDPIAQLDGKTAAYVWRQIVQRFAETTVLLVSQRIVQPESFDHIFVLDQGGLLESGTHKTLLERHGLYQRLFNLQRLRTSV